MNKKPFGIPRELPVWVEVSPIPGIAIGPVFLVDPMGIFGGDQPEGKTVRRMRVTPPKGVDSPVERLLEDLSRATTYPWTYQ